MSVYGLLPQGAVNSAAGAGVVASLQSASQAVIVVDKVYYSLLAVALSLAGVWLARMVTIDEENKRLGREQRWSETGPLTWIGILIVAPAVWHFNLAVPWAAIFGLGVGYSVRLVLKIIGAATIAAGRAIAQQTAQALGAKESLPATPVPHPVEADGTHADELLPKLDAVPPTPSPPALPSPDEKQ